MPHINLEEVDVDGAIREAAEEVGSDTRLGFLRKAGIAGGAAVSGGAILGALVPSALAAGSGRPPASFGKGDIGILNYALTLEYLERAFYNEAAAGGKIHAHQLKKLLTVVVADERAHVKFLKGALGKHAVKEPKFNFKGIPKDQKMFAAVAQVLENTGVHAYSGQGGNINNPAYLGAAVSILTIEARHAGAFGLINNPVAKSITPQGPFDTPLTAAQVLAAVTATGFIVG